MTVVKSGRALSLYGGSCKLYVPLCIARAIRRFLVLEIVCPRCVGGPLCDVKCGFLSVGAIDRRDVEAGHGRF